MTARLFLALLACFFSAAAVPGAEEAAAKPSARERLRARMAEDAKKAEDAKSAPPAAAPAAGAATGAPSPAPAPAATVNRPANEKPRSGSGDAKAANAAAKKEAPTVMPKMEVTKQRITVLDQKLAKQDEDIAREKKNLQSSEVDNAFNDGRLARPLAIFGGESTQFRKGVASERVELMEAEKDLMEAIAHAKTKEEKAELQKQLNELKAMRRELDRTMR